MISAYKILLSVIVLELTSKVNKHGRSLNFLFFELIGPLGLVHVEC